MKISDAMKLHLLMLSEWWGHDESRPDGSRLMTYAPVTEKRKILVILRTGTGGLPEVEIYPTPTAARAAWEERGDRTEPDPA